MRWWGRIDSISVTLGRLISGEDQSRLLLVASANSVSGDDGFLAETRSAFFIKQLDALEAKKKMSRRARLWARNTNTTHD